MLLQEFPDILTVQQMQKALNIGRSWAYRLLDERKISSFRIGRTYKIPKSAVIDFIRDQAS